jgi:hypothetical protein
MSLSNWHEQWPSNKGDIETSVTGQVGYSVRGVAFGLFFMP